MRLRHALFAIFAVLATLPVIVFWFWSQSLYLQGEFDEVRDRHLLLARNLGAALQRYHSDVSAVFDLIAGGLVRGEEIKNVDELFGRIGLKNICLVDAATGIVKAGVDTEKSNCPKTVPVDLVQSLRALDAMEQTVFSDVKEGVDGTPVIYVVCDTGDQLVIGVLGTEYFVRLGKAISFGVKGHAAIVDSAGNVLAHPLKSWIMARKNIAGVSAVKRMMAGESGIQQFYSPALKGDMIAGFTSVAGPGWGVMIPQPIAELHKKAARSQDSAFAILAICLIAVAFLSMITAYYLSWPLEQIVKASDKSNRASLLTEIMSQPRWRTPYELYKVQRSFNRMVRRLRQNLASIKNLAYSDAITGLPNRAAFEFIVQRELKRLKNMNENGVMFFIDLDDFKDINDTLGHDYGNVVLRTLKESMADGVKAASNRAPLTQSLTDSLQFQIADGSPIIARLGGDEFAIFVPEISEESEIEPLLARIQECICQPVQLDGEEITIAASIGAACYPLHADNYAILLKLADLAMCQAKKNGKNKTLIYNKLIGATTVAEVRRDVSAAIRNNDLILHYQPKICCETGQIDSVEALVRWRHPERGLLAAYEFIPMIENSKVVVELGEWALRTAAKDSAFWHKKGLKLCVAVNIASRHFSSGDFVDRVKHIVQVTKLNPKLLELEITEEATIGDLAAAKATIVALQEAGIHISLDDFGRGYSNLRRLTELPVNAIKLDAPLTSDVGSDPRVATIVKAAVDMAKGLGCDTVAEGVETAKQASVLMKLGCTHLQGYHFAKPMDRVSIVRWIASSKIGKIQEMQELLVKKLASNA